MTRALDGTYWRVKWFTEHNGVWWRSSRYQSRGEALEAVFNKLRGGHQRHNVKIVRIRPRMSIVRAVRLLTEARAKGVELWIRRYDMRGWIKIDRDLPVWATDDFAKPGTHATSMFTAYMLLTRWIVATPEDARRIDARRGS